MSTAGGFAALLTITPAASGLIGLVLPYRYRRLAGGLGCFAAAVVLIGAISALWLDLDGGIRGPNAQFGEFDVQLSLRLNITAAVVAVLVGAVALAVQMYSINHLANDSRYVPYAAQISLFVAAMVAVVCADDLVTMLIGWEVMGLCSYLLIGHDRGVAQAPRAAVKAFVVTRFGDIGFVLGIIVLGLAADSFRLSAVLNADYSSTTVTAAGLLLLAGIAGKSAQFPLHIWLPDAMAGPSPVSALIHAATMVAAGVYVLLTMRPIFAASDTTMLITAAIGAMTLLIGALAAAVTDDLKRVLAYSTMSQLGSIVAVCGLPGAVSPAALFHLLSHGAFKALLFLCAGWIIHLVATNSMAAMGGLRRVAPVTFYCATVGLVATAGLPPVGGFWSKEALLDAAEHDLHSTAGWLVNSALWLSIPLTAWYCARSWLMVFFGSRRGALCDNGDPGPLRRWPLIALALAVVGIGGLAFVSDPLIIGWSAQTVQPQVWTSVISVAVSAAGAALAWLVWRTQTARDPAWIFGSATQFFANGFYIDTVARAVVVIPITWGAHVVRRIDEQRIDGAVRLLARLAGATASVATTAHQSVARYATVTLCGAIVLGIGAWTAWAVLT